MGTATLVKRLTGWRGDAALYRLDPPLATNVWDWRKRADGTRLLTHVIVSATIVPYGGPETYIFPASAEGEVTDWGELEGSYRGGLDHAEALAGAGYEIGG